MKLQDNLSSKKDNDLNQLNKQIMDLRLTESNEKCYEKKNQNKLESIKISSQAYPQIQDKYLKTQQQFPSTIVNPIQGPKILKPKAQSQVHQKLQKIKFTSQSHQQPIQIREYRIEDLNQLKKLQNQWFPIRYSDQFYKKILRKQCYCIVAETKIKVPQPLIDNESQTNIQGQKILIGAAVFQFTDSQGYAYRSWGQSFLSLLKSPQNSIYIMTLGVIDQFRKKGVGKMLIKEILKMAKKHNNVKLVYLHVISYNKAAIKFYKNIGFSQLDSLSNFYHVGEKQYDGQIFGIFVNDGERNAEWSLRLRKMLK